MAPMVTIHTASANCRSSSGFVGTCRIHSSLAWWSWWHRYRGPAWHVPILQRWTCGHIWNMTILLIHALVLFFSLIGIVVGIGAVFATLALLVHDATQHMASCLRQ